MCVSRQATSGGPAGATRGAAESRLQSDLGSMADACNTPGPIRRSDAGLLVGFYVMVTLLWTGIGVLIKHVGEDGALGNADRDIEEWLVERRTPSCDTLSLFSSMLSETAIKIVVTASLTRAEARRLNARTGHQPDEARPSEDPDRFAPRAPAQASQSVLRQSRDHVATVGT